MKDNWMKAEKGDYHVLFNIAFAFSGEVTVSGIYLLLYAILKCYIG